MWNVAWLVFCRVLVTAVVQSVQLIKRYQQHSDVSDLLILTWSRQPLPPSQCSDDFIVNAFWHDTHERSTAYAYTHTHTQTWTLQLTTHLPSYYHPRESDGICFHRRWFVCQCVCLWPRLAKQIVDGFVPNFMWRFLGGKGRPSSCFVTIGRGMWK